MKTLAAPLTESGERLGAIYDRLLGASVLALFLIVYILPLGYRPLFSPDETRYAEIPREMLSTGDWVVPRLNGLRYFEKPPLGYWVNAVSLRVLGSNPFAVRLPGVLAVALTAFLVYFFTRRLSGNPSTGLLGAIVYLTSTEVYTVGTFSVLDNLLNFCITAGMIAFHCAVRAEQIARQRILSALSGIAFGGAFLTKGFLGFVVPVIVFLPWLAWSGQLRAGLARAWPALATALIVSAPWALSIHLRESDFWRYFFWEEHVRRFLADNAQHNHGALYFLKYLPALAFPWVFFLPATCAGLSTDDGPRPGKVSVYFLWFWLLLPFVFFSASNGKLITYILPCFPPLAILTALGLTSYLSRGRRRLFDKGQLFVSGVFALLLLAVVAAQTTDRFDAFFRAEEGVKTLLIAAALLLGTVSGIFAVRANRPRAKLLGCMLSIVPLLAVTQAAMPDSIIERKAPGVLLSRMAVQLAPDPVVVSNSGIARAAAWYFRRDDIYMTVRGGELLYGLDYPDAANRYLDEAAFGELIRGSAGLHDVVMVCKRDCGKGYESLMPADAQRYDYGPYTLWHVPRVRSSTGN
jgi:4-amino-4-deoxy-L-arabinose transferase